MNIEDYLVRFYPETEITCYPWVYHDRYEHYLPNGHSRTGPMDWGKFSTLKEDIKQHGVENPFIIEFYCKDKPNAEGLLDKPVLAIRTGNNRAEAMSQLGLTRAPALFVVPRTQEPHLPNDEYRDLNMDYTLEREVNALWKEVPREHNSEPLGVKGAWRDSQLLEDLIRISKNVL